MIRRYMVWVDANGATRLTFINANAGLGSVQADLLALSQADMLNCVENTLTVYTPAPPGGTFRSVGDVAILTFTDAGSNLVDITLPAPVSTIFLADEETVDATAIVTLIGDVVGTVQTAAGGVVTAYVSGTRQTKKGNPY
jgi:hypothetical protein